MLTFKAQRHNAPINKGGRRTDSAAFCFLHKDKFRDYRDEAHLSTKQPRAGSPPWFPSPYGNRRWPQHPECTPRTWSQEAICLITDPVGAWL
jgi:hypothetical protein